MKLATNIIAGFMIIAIILMIVAGAGVILGNNVARSRSIAEEKYDNRNLINQYSVGLHHEYQMAFMYILDPTSPNADEYLEQKESYCNVNEGTFDEIYENAIGEDYYSAMNDINDILLDMDIMFENFVNDSDSSAINERYDLIDDLDSQLTIIITGTGSDDFSGFDYVDQELMNEIDAANSDALDAQELMTIVNFVGIVIAIATSVIMGGVIARSISKPLKKITVASRKVMDGDLGVSVDETGNSEVIELAKSFNHMTLSIRQEIARRENTEKILRDENNRSTFYLDLMSHDINNLNQGSLISLQLMLVIPGLPDRHREYAEVALQQAQGSANLISNVKKLSLLQMSGDKLDALDIFPLFDEAVASVRASSPTKQIKINTNITEGKCMVKGNALLVDMFSNLLNNSAKFDRHEIVEIDVEVSDEKGFWKINYMDRGPGINDSRKEIVFNRLERGDSEIHGSGLGLTLVKQIIESYGGRVWIEDRVKGNSSQGANFILLVPRGE